VMVRTQVQLTEEQAQAVKRMAAERGVSMAEIIRTGIETLVQAQGKPTKEELRRRTLLAIGIAHSGLGDLASNHDEYLAEAYEG